MTTPENPRIARPKHGRAKPHRKPATGVPRGMAVETKSEPPPTPTPQTGVNDPDVLAVNEAVASTVKSAYEVLSHTVAQGRKAAEQFRVGEYNVRDVPEDVRQMAGNLLGLARQLSNATFNICEALLRQADGMTTPPPPGSTHVPPFQPPKSEHAAAGPVPASAPAPAPAAASPTAPPTAHAIALTVAFEGHDSARAHTTTLARPHQPTATEQFACDGLAQRGGSAAPITAVAFDPHPDGHGMLVTVGVPPEHPKGIYVGAVYCATQDLPLGQLVIEIE